MGHNLELTEAEQKYLEAYLIRNEAGPSIAPILCNQACGMRKSCPLVDMGKDPARDIPCPLEVGQGDVWYRKFFKALNLDPEDYVDKVMLREAVNWMTLENRFYHEFRNNPNAAERTMRGVDKDNEPIFDIKPNPVLKSMKESSARKGAIFKSLAATRLEKAKLNVVHQEEPSVIAARTQKALEDLQRDEEEKRKAVNDRGGKLEEIEDADYEVKD